MFREMRRSKQELTARECGEILNRGTSGVLAVHGDGGYPYAVPLSYVYDGECIVFHCAKQGHKLDAVNEDDKVSFCVIDEDQVVPEKFTTFYRSAIAFGRAHVIEDEAERRAALTGLAVKYTPDDEVGVEGEVEKMLDHVCLVRIDVEHLSGKQAKELVRAR